MMCGNNTNSCWRDAYDLNETKIESGGLDSRSDGLLPESFVSE